MYFAVDNFYWLANSATMFLRSCISIEISARTDATSVRCNSRMCKIGNVQSHLAEANASILYFLHKHTESYLSNEGYQLFNVQCAAEGCSFVLGKNDEVVSSTRPVYTCENCTKGSIPCTFFFCGSCYNAKFSEQEGDSGKKRKHSSRTNRAKPRRFG